jgi:predicted nucleotidyltransferase
MLTIPLTTVNNKLETILTKLRAQLKNYYGDRLQQLILFGSQARGDAQPDSDIDVLVILKGDVNAGEEIEKTSYFIADLCLETDTVISCIFMAKDQFRNRSSPLLRNIHREGITL